MTLSHASSSIYLPFLRPRAFPCASTLQRFLSSSATSNSSNTPSPTQSTAPDQILSTSMTAASAIMRPDASPNLPYRIRRTPSSLLPIYLLAKRGGNLKQTKLRKIEGDINTLRVELRDALKLDDKEIVINQLTRHIIIRGWRKPEVAKFLEERQF